MEAQKAHADFGPMLVTGYFDRASALQDTLLCLQVIANTKVSISIAAHKIAPANHLAWYGIAPTINFKAQSEELHHTCKEWK